MVSNDEIIKKLKRSSSYIKLKNDLISQLESRNSATPIFLDMVETYMELWILVKLLIKDIRTRGVFITTANGRDEKVQKKNDSCGELNKTIGQMCKMLAQMKLNVKDESVDKDIDDIL